MSSNRKDYYDTMAPFFAAANGFGAATGNSALIENDSPHQVHLLVATIWAGKLTKSVVIAANRGYLPGKVSFSMRTKTDTNLLEFLKRYRSTDQKMGFGHERATGGIVAVDDFKRLSQCVRRLEQLA